MGRCVTKWQDSFPTEKEAVHDNCRNSVDDQRGRMNASDRTMDAVLPDSRPVMLLPMAVGFFFSFRLLTVLLTVRLFQQDPQTGVAVGLGLNFLLLALVLFQALGPAPKSLASMFRMPCFRWVLVFLGFSGCSLLWSSTASLAAAIAYWCAMAADVAMVLLLLRTGPVEEMSRALMKGYIWASCTIALIAWILPAQSDLRLGDEELLGPNQIGYACGFAIFFAQYLIRSKERFWTIPAAFLAITLLRSLSKTTIVAFMAGQVFFLFRDRSISRQTKVMLVVAAVVVTLIFWSLFQSYYVVYENAGNQAETLTGRLGIWAYFLEQALEKPWFGHGFHSVWKVIPPFGEFEARHAHNELLQQFYAYGLVGVGMLVAIYSSVFRQIRRLATGPQKTFFLGLLLFILIRGLADTEAFDLSLPLWAITMIGAILSESSMMRSVPV
jgi:exopolysaccharide production protein ExoQ